jgi:peptidoglycan/LPS O-acetylase OafA/YrhL
MPELDSIRGIAVLMVLFYHSFFWGTDLSLFPTLPRLFLQATWVGKLGVNLFFVLSGFLITGLLLKARDRPDYYRTFYIRRALRILPAYLATLLVLALAGFSLKFIGLSLLYLANLTPLFGVLIAYPVLWSLAVEQHFYLLWPFAVRNLAVRGVMAVSAAILLLSPLLRWLTFQVETTHGWVSYQVFDYTWNSADGLACGALLALWLWEFSPSRKKIRRVLAVLLAACLALSPFAVATRHSALGAALQVVPWNFLFLALIVAALLVGSRWGDRARLRVLEFFGEISYGLYLYQLLVFWTFEWLVDKGIIPRLQINLFLGLTIRFLICGSVAVGIAFLSRRFLEAPFLKWKYRFSPGSGPPPPPPH